MSENSNFITDENGKEIEMKIYLTFDMEGKKYVVVYDASKEDELYALTYDEEGNLYVVESDEELAMVDEVVGAYEEEN